MGWSSFGRCSWRRLCALSWPERWLLLEATLLLPATAFAVRMLGLRSWHRALVRLAPPVTELAVSEESLRKAQTTARLVRAARQYGVQGCTCLHQSLTLWWLLRQQGITSDLRIGVRKQAGQLEAHAWVEHHGTVLDDRDDTQRSFAPFERAIVTTRTEAQ